jgi:BASS family bile acid:Na+ symporter
MFARAITWIADRGPLAVAASIFVALAVPQLAELVRPLLPVSVFCLLTVAMIRIDLDVARQHLRNPRLMLIGLVWMMVAIPIIMGVLIALIGVPPAIALGLILLGTAPATVSSPAMSQLLKLDGTFSLAMLLVAMVVTPFTVPALTEFILDADLAISTSELAVRLTALIGGSAVTAFIARKLIKAEPRARAEPVFDCANVAFMALFAVSAMDGVTHALLTDTAHTLGLIGFAFALNLGMLAVTAALFWRAGPVHALTIGFSCANRNMALAISALAGHVDPDTWIFFAVVQFPIYITPLILKPITKRLLGPNAMRQ